MIERAEVALPARHCRSRREIALIANACGVFRCGDLGDHYVQCFPGISNSVGVAPRDTSTTERGLPAEEAQRPRREDARASWFRATFSQHQLGRRQRRRTTTVGGTDCRSRCTAPREKRSTRRASGGGCSWRANSLRIGLEGGIEIAAGCRDVGNLRWRSASRLP